MKYTVKNLNQDELRNIVGVNDANISLLEQLYGCGIVYRDDYFNLLSDDEEVFNKFRRHMNYIVSKCKDNIIDRDFITHSFMQSDEEEDDDFAGEIIAYSYSGKPYRCKTHNQHRFIKAIKKDDLIFSIGPAGTGKTFLSVLLAVNYLRKGLINRIVITRPAVEAGESLGFLPGDLKEKVDPYLMPIYDALEAILGKEKKDSLIEKGVIEIMPLAYMRGRTLDEAFIILDEAQNTTDKQMLMFLTRMGFNSKMIVNGDVTQIDLNVNRNRSGLILAAEKLKDVDGISFVEFNNNDMIRNP